MTIAQVQPASLRTQNKPGPLKGLIRKLLPSSLRKPEPESEAATPPRIKPGKLSFAGRVAAVILLTAVTMFAFTRKTDAKPPPYSYENTSGFGYFLGTPTGGMNGQKTTFWVKEGGASIKLPLSLSLEGTKTTLTTMALGGVTRCEGVPETDFFKVALTSNTSFSVSGIPGNFKVALGGRVIKVYSREFTCPVPGTEHIPNGPKIHIPEEEMKPEWDVGGQVKWATGRGEKPLAGFLTSANFGASVFDMMQRFRVNYWVFSGSVGFKGGWGLGVSGETKTGNVGVMGDKAWVWKRGTYILFAGSGYDFGPKSVSGYVGAKIGPVMILSMVQAEQKDNTSYHLLITVSPGDMLNALKGGKPAHGR